MCFFPHINTDFTGEAFRAGVKEFGCGYCPECLQKRSRSWVVRAFYERETSGSCMMLTLTYDHFKRDKNGNILRDRLGYPLEEQQQRSRQECGQAPAGCWTAAKNRQQ